MRPMLRYIDENDVYALFAPNGTARLHVADIDVLPRVDAVEVVHSHAVLAEATNIVCTHKCARCDALIVFNDNYCPNCGAKIDLEG